MLTRNGRTLQVIVLLLATVVAIACGGRSSPSGEDGRAAVPTFEAATATPTEAAAASTPEPLSDEARLYLTEALDHIERNALYRDRVDWPRTRAEAFQLAAGARTPVATYPAIRMALSRLNDRHSGLIDPDRAQQSAQGVGTGTPTGERLEGNIGYLALPQAVGSAPGYAETAQRLIRELDQPPVCGWVVDLRQNTGGNMWHMLSGVGPILGEGEVGGFDDGRGQRTTWSYRDGASYNHHTAAVRVSDPYRPAHPDRPVAVLTGPRTGSSGEAVVLSFRGRPQTRSFGEPTAGVPTANAGRRLSDGAVLNLTVSRMADRTGRAYETKLEPDERVPSGALEAAHAWLRAQPGCA